MWLRHEDEKYYKMVECQELNFQCFNFQKPGRKYNNLVLTKTTGTAVN